MSVPRTGDGLGLRASQQQPTVYVGQVATNCHVLTSTTGPNKQTMDRSYHRMRESVTSLQVAWTNWYVPSTGIETAIGAAMDITASVEYPIGTFTQIKFSGAVQGSIANGATLVSDPVTVTIPAGAEFYIRAWKNNANGILYKTTTVANGVGKNQCTFGVTATDQTMGGTVTVTSNTVWSPPAAIIANTRRPSVFLCGDSRTEGSLDAPNNSWGDHGEVARAIGQKFAYINAGVSGDKPSVAKTNYTKRLVLAAYCSHVIDQLGINDITRTAAQIAADRATIAALFTTQQVYGTTLSPDTTSTDSWATATNQTVTANEANRTGFNDLARAGIAGELGCFDLADAVEVNSSNVLTRNGGRWITNGTANWPTTDGLHGTNTANEIMQRYVQAGMQALAR